MLNVVVKAWGASSMRKLESKPSAFQAQYWGLTDYKMEVFDSVEALNEAFNLFYTHSTRLDSDACYHQFHYLVAEWIQSQEATGIDTLIKLRNDLLELGQALLDADTLDALDTASSVLAEMSDDEPTALLSTMERARWRGAAARRHCISIIVMKVIVISINTDCSLFKAVS